MHKGLKRPGIPYRRHNPHRGRHTERVEERPRERHPMTSDSRAQAYTNASITHPSWMLRSLFSHRLWCCATCVLRNTPAKSPPLTFSFESVHPIYLLKIYNYTFIYTFRKSITRNRFDAQFFWCSRNLSYLREKAGLNFKPKTLQKRASREKR